MYCLHDNKLTIRYKNINNYTSYLKILKSLDFIKLEANFMKKKLVIKLDNLIILDYIDNISLLYRCLTNFNNILLKLNVYPSQIINDDLLILYNKRNDKYIIMGLEFGKDKTNLLDVFSSKFKINFNNFSKNLQIIYFLDKINPDIEQKINNDIFTNNLSIITDDYNTNKYLPIAVMKKKFSRYLSNVLYFIKQNIAEITKSDFIIISKNGYDSKLFDLEYILNIKNYDIIGEKDNNGIRNKSNNLKIIKKLFEDNETGIKDLDIDSFYKSYKYMIFNTKFIISIIDKIIEKEIIDISIICSYYNQF